MPTYLPYRKNSIGCTVPFALVNGVAVTFETRELAQDFLHDAWDSGDRDYTAGIVEIQYLPVRYLYSDERIPYSFSNGVAETFATFAEAEAHVKETWDDRVDAECDGEIFAVTRDGDGWFVDSDGRLVCHETGEEPCGYDSVDDIRDAEWTVNGEPA